MATTAVGSVEWFNAHVFSHLLGLGGTPLRDPPTACFPNGVVFNGGLFCDDDGRGNVTHIMMSSFSLSGSLPSALGEMQALQQVWLFNNALVGTIPTQLFALSSLLSLSLYRNRLSGTIPSEIGALSRLVEFDVNTNRLSGRVPDSVSQLTALEKFSIAHNGFSGRLPRLRVKPTSEGGQYCNLYDNNFVCCYAPGTSSLCSDPNLFEQPLPSTNATAGATSAATTTTASSTTPAPPPRTPTTAAATTTSSSTPTTTTTTTTTTSSTTTATSRSRLTAAQGAAVSSAAPVPSGDASGAPTNELLAMVGGLLTLCGMVVFVAVLLGLFVYFRHHTRLRRQQQRSADAASRSTEVRSVPARQAQPPPQNEYGAPPARLHRHGSSHRHAARRASSRRGRPPPATAPYYVPELAPSTTGSAAHSGASYDDAPLERLGYHRAPYRAGFPHE